MSIGSIVGGIVGGVVGFYLGGPMGAVYGASIGMAGGMILDPLVPDVPTAGLPDPGENVMLSTIGDPIKDLCGTAKITGHLLVYGGERNEAQYASSEGGGGKGGPPEPEPQITGYKYYMSWAVGICVGPINTIYTIYKNDDVVWEGELDIPVSGGMETITLDEMGSCSFYFGSDDQVINSKYGAILEDETLNSPMRNFCWCFFDDCYIGEYNRTPTMKFVVRKQPAITLSSATSTIQIYDSNPMHAIWYILHDLCQLDETWLDEDEFNAVATELFLKSRGISILMDRQQTALDYLQTINSHIDSIIRYGADAKFHPILIRDDYDIDTIPSVTEIDCLDDPSFSRKSWIDTINEVKVQYTELLATRPITPIDVVGGYAPGQSITWTDTLGGSKGRYVITSQTGSIYYSDDGGVSWTSATNPGDPDSDYTIYRVRWIAELSAFVACFKHSLLKSADGINWTAGTDQTHEYDFFQYAPPTWSTRAGRLFLGTNQGGSSSKVHTSLDGLSLNVAVDTTGSFNFMKGVCQFGTKLLAFSSNYSSFWVSDTPDTTLSDFVAFTPNPAAVMGSPRGQLATDQGTVAYSGCYFNGSVWAVNDGTAFHNIDYNADENLWGAVAITARKVYYGSDGINWEAASDSLLNANNYHEVAVGNDRMIVVTDSGTGHCIIIQFAE